jgi:YegS/Rv2252/BmrU family lipid kinase
MAEDAEAVQSKRYGIIVNPKAGRSNLKNKRRVMSECAEILGPGTEIAGWETTSPEELKECARVLASKVDVLVVAGGDGTLSDIINALEDDTVLSYIPMGTGNAWRNTLKLPVSRRKAAERIRAGKEHAVDLVMVDAKRKGILASVGFEGHALREREKLLEKGIGGFDAYFRATAKSILWGYKGEDALVELDGEKIRVRQAISLIVTKTPFYGYGLKVVPKAQLDDGLLHVMLVSGRQHTTISSIVTSMMGGNLLGQYITCEHVDIETDKELHLQIDGNLERKGTDFEFQVLPSALRMRY